MVAYYNEHDPFAAAWLRNLIAAGLIAGGDVDERSIEDVLPQDLRGYAQCHFFAGIGGWSYALRLANWPDDRPVWTGSCPCQPFSAAGKGTGHADERHLWPAWHHLIRECKPPVVFGEQVEAAINHGWLDLVQADLEGEGYAVGATGLPAASIGAPHIRSRLWFVAEWMADAENDGRDQREQISGRGTTGNESRRSTGRSDDRSDGGLADTSVQGPQGWSERGNSAAQWTSGARGVDDGLAYASGKDQGGGRVQRSRQGYGKSDGAACERSAGLRADGGMADAAMSRRPEAREHERRSSQLPARPSEHGGMVRPANAPDGFWRAADWLCCRDGKWRPVEPSTFPLVDGSAFKLGSGSSLQGKSRVGMLRAAGNAIVPQVASEVIHAYLSSRLNSRSLAHCRSGSSGTLFEEVQ